MEEADQAEVIGFLADPMTHVGGPRVERIETHGNLIFLAGSEAWKIKRSVRFPYMDFSTLEKRKAACWRELEVNRRTAPPIYLGCVPITRSADGGLRLGGSGAIVEWAVHMRRFEQSALLSSVAATAGIGMQLAIALADVVYESHHHADRIAAASGTAHMSGLVKSVGESLAHSRVCDGEEVARFSRLAEAQLGRAAPILDARARRGAVRRCHGDLHLGNIVLWHERPMLFDAIEFDEAIATIDVLYDLAFLLMDLDRYGERRAANVVFNRYLRRGNESLDLSGLQVLPLFLGLRAAIRAMVTADRAVQEDDGAAAEDRQRARSYLGAACCYLTPCSPTLIAIGGPSGTGKSTLGAALAAQIGPAPGAVHLRSDLERKALFGVEETVRLPAAAYTCEATHSVYAMLRDKACRVLTAGHSAIADAVYPTERARSGIDAMARGIGVEFHGLWLTADRSTLVARVDARWDDASDATSEIVERQLSSDRGELSPAWRVVDAAGSRDATLRHARCALETQPGAPGRDGGAAS